MSVYVFLGIFALSLTLSAFYLIILKPLIPLLILKWKYKEKVSDNIFIFFSLGGTIVFSIDWNILSINYKSKEILRALVISI